MQIHQCNNLEKEHSKMMYKHCHTMWMTCNDEFNKIEELIKFKKELVDNEIWEFKMEHLTQLMLFSSFITFETNASWCQRFFSDFCARRTGYMIHFLFWDQSAIILWQTIKNLRHHIKDHMHLQFWVVGVDETGVNWRDTVWSKKTLNATPITPKGLVWLPGPLLAQTNIWRDCSHYG
jgi:hypothetical protein